MYMYILCRYCVSDCFSEVLSSQAHDTPVPLLPNYDSVSSLSKQNHMPHRKAWHWGWNILLASHNLAPLLSSQVRPSVFDQLPASSPRVRHRTQTLQNSLAVSIYRDQCTALNAQIQLLFHLCLLPLRSRHFWQWADCIALLSVFRPSLWSARCCSGWNTTPWWSLCVPAKFSRHQLQQRLESSRSLLPWRATRSKPGFA